MPEASSTGGTHGARLWLTLAVLVMAVPAGAQSPETLPSPDRNPARGILPNSATEHPLETLPNDPWQQSGSAEVDSRILAARAHCAELLQNIVLDYEPLPPIKGRACGAKAPILVKSVGANPAIVISPPARMNCTLAVALHAWLKDTVQPTAAAFGSSVVKVRNALSYECRRRYGGTNTKISEHAVANAVDISGFVLASGQLVTVLKGWPLGAGNAALPVPPTMPLVNPRRLEALVAARPAGSDEATGAILVASSPQTMTSTLAAVTNMKPGIFTGLNRPSAARLTHSALLQSSLPAHRSEWRERPMAPFHCPLPSLENEFSAQVADPVIEDQKMDAVSPAQLLNRNLEPQEAGAFVRSIHADACKVFETVLGPKANASHRDHFHLDMKKRRYVKICE